jgi:hypothetical protein
VYLRIERAGADIGTVYLCHDAHVHHFVEPVPGRCWTSVGAAGRLVCAWVLREAATSAGGTAPMKRGSDLLMYLLRHGRCIRISLHTPPSRHLQESRRAGPGQIVTPVCEPNTAAHRSSSRTNEASHRLPRPAMTSVTLFAAMRGHAYAARRSVIWCATARSARTDGGPPAALRIAGGPARGQARSGAGPDPAGPARARSAAASASRPA